MKITRLLTITVVLIIMVAKGCIFSDQPASAASSWIVTSGNDSGSGTLRSYLENNSQVKDGDSITFDSSLSQVTLISTLAIGKAVLLEGDLNAPGTPRVTIAGNLSNRLISISAAAIIDNLAFTNSGSGGALAISAGATLNHCLFSGNTAVEGGAISNVVASPHILNCTFLQNHTPPTYGTGGAIYNNTSSPTIANCSFSSNSAASGGAIYNVSSSPVIRDCLFENNQSTASNGGGGAIYSNSSSPAISGSFFWSNSAAISGGALYNVSSTPVLTNCLLAYNQTTLTGGVGGAIYSMTSSPTAITNCTFTANQATTGGAFYNHQSTVNITNSIFYGDSSELGKPTWQDASYYSVTYSDIQGGFSGIGNMDSDPCFVSPNDLHLRSLAGHYTSTGWVTDSATSPAIDAGNPASEFVNEPSYSRGHIEMGAYGNTAQASKTSFTLATAVVGKGTLTATLQPGAGQETYTLFAAPDSGNDFSGWNGDLSGAANPSEIILDENKAVTAVFTDSLQNYTLELSSPHGLLTVDPDQTQFTAGESVQLSVSPDPGYIFDKWSGEIGNADSSANPLTVTMDQDRTITAECQADGTFWYLDRYSQMEKGLDADQQSGGVVLNSAAATLWLSQQAAGHDVMFDTGSWTTVIHTTDPEYTIEIGRSSSSDPNDFQPLAGQFNQVVRANHDASYTIIVTAALDQEYQISEGQYLAVKIVYNGAGNSQILTDASSYLLITESHPTFPLPEIPAWLLLVLGLGALTALGVIRRRRSSAR
jgi:predicted outer membrane repeat protein